MLQTHIIIIIIKESMIQSWNSMIKSEDSVIQS
jgi:hypothetical protein